MTHFIVKYTLIIVYLFYNLQKNFRTEGVTQILIMVKHDV